METLEQFPSLDFLSFVNIIMKEASWGAYPELGSVQFALLCGLGQVPCPLWTSVSPVVECVMSYEVVLQYRGLNPRLTC